MERDQGYAVGNVFVERPYRAVGTITFLNYWGGGGQNRRDNSAITVAETGKSKNPDPSNGSIPDNNPALVIKIGEFSAYNADPAQTDDDPYTMANGQRVYAGAVANNCMPFGAKIMVDGVEYTVADRMNKRYGCDHFDLFMPDHGSAVAFGRKQLEYAIIN